MPITNISDMQSRPSMFGGASPIAILGMIIIAIPFLSQVFKWGIPGWVSIFGVILLIIGVVGGALMK